MSIIQVGAVLNVIDGPFASYQTRIVQVEPFIRGEVVMFGKTGVAIFRPQDLDPSQQPVVPFDGSKHRRARQVYRFWRQTGCGRLDALHETCHELNAWEVTERGTQGEPIEVRVPRWVRRACRD